jgi:hypothetical protein
VEPNNIVVKGGFKIIYLSYFVVKGGINKTENNI